MEKITKKELKTILEQHELWLVSNEKEGKRADLYGANLTCADLSGANLSRAYLRCANLTCAKLSGTNLTNADLTSANLTGANLSRADLTDANLTGANLTGANLRFSDLTGANLTGAILRHANLSYANLTGADLTRAHLNFADLTSANLTRAHLNFADLTSANLTGAYLTSANLSGADFTGADLTGANLTDTILDEKEQCRKGIVLTEPMTGYKKSNEGKIITLEIPIGAKVFSINNNKRRTNKVKVIDMQGETELCSIHDNKFKYHAGDEIEIKDFDERYNVECGAGIHFFLTREEAESFEY